MKSHLFGWKPVFRYLLVLFILLGANLYGATHTVSNEDDLSDAIGFVNSSGTDDTITFTGNIGLEAVSPDINKATGTLTIEGNGYTLSRNTGAIAFRVLTINAGDVTIDRLTISGGYVSTGSGGGIYSRGTLTLTNCTVSNNTADSGGGIYSSGTLTLTNCTVSGNTANVYGGGIYNYDGGILTLTNCTVSGNTAGYGGGICNDGTLTLTNCTVSGNMAGGNGGGIDSYEGMLTLTNCTVLNNTAGNYGGGVFQFNGTLTLIRNIVSGNTAPNGSEIYVDQGPITADAHNVFGYSGLTNSQAYSGFTPGATDVTCTSDAPLIGIHRPKALASILSPLADNGGPTQTHALVANSPAIDRDQVSLAGSYPATDQRGVVRPYGLGVDAGAYEYPSFQSMSVSPGHRDFAAAGGDQNVTVTSSVVWTVTYAPDWLTITPISGNGDWSVILTASANSGLYRTGSITFSANGVTDVTVNVSQASGVVPPSVSTFVASGIGLEEATLGGNVSADGGAAVTARGVVYSSIDSTPTIGESGVTQVSIGNGTGDFSQAVSGLTPGTTYYVCAYATNGAGTGYGAVTSFSTLDLPGVTTQDPTEITPTTATLNGNIDALGVPAATQHGFVWDTSANPTVALSTKSEQGAPSASGAFHYALTGLTPGAVYYVRAYITNDAGTAYGEDKPFVASNLTLSVTPETLNLPAAGSTVEVNVTSNTAWTASSDQSWLGLSPASGTNDGVVELTVPAHDGPERVGTITISAPGVASCTVTVTQATGAVPPGVTTQDPTEITPTTATLNGNIDALGVPAATQHGFVWDTSANPTVALSTKSEQGAPSASGAFHYALTGLTPGAVYYVRAYITNDAGTAYGEDKPFVASNLTLSVTPETLNLPGAGSTVEVNVTSNTAWTASSDQSWLGLSPASGTNDGLVELTASPNLAWGSRSAVVTFSADGVLSRTVTVTQASGQSDGDLGLVLNSPTDELVQAGESLIKVFRLVNASAHAVNVTLSVACSQPGWMASIPGGATAVVDASGHLDIPTQVEVAAGAMPGDRCDVSLSVVTEALEVSNSVELTVTLNRIAISPLPADFGLVPMGSPAVQSLSLVNHGDEPVMVGTVTVSGSGLTIMNDGVSGQTIPAGASRALQLQFNPLAAGVVNGQLNWPIQAPHAESILTGVTGTGLYTPPPPPPPPEPEPILEEHHHNLLGNTARFNLWNLDPNGLLPPGTAWSVVQGTLPGGLRIRDGWVAGIFRNTGSYSFQLKAETDAVTVIHTFTVRVMTPTVCPTIFGAWINGDYLSIEVLEDARHGVAAQTAPMRMTLEPGQSTEIRFDWDYIKDDFSFRLIDGDLPPGLILDGDSGVISGVPSASGSYRFLVSVKDWRGRGYQWVEVNIP